MLFGRFDFGGKVCIVMPRFFQDVVHELTSSLQIYKNNLINVKNTLNNSGHGF
jgi:hypothetical protein